MSELSAGLEVAETQLAFLVQSRCIKVSFFSLNYGVVLACLDVDNFDITEVYMLWLFLVFCVLVSKLAVVTKSKRENVSSL